MKQELFDLTGKVAVVTGTSRGLGQYLGRALAKAGADLVITSRDPATLSSFQKEIEALGRRALPLALDVRDHDSIQKMADAAATAMALPGRSRIIAAEADQPVAKLKLSITKGHTRA